MEIEFEATFPNVNKEDIRRRLKKAGAKLLRKEFLQKRAVFHLPEGHEIKGAWLRVRDESDKTTLSLKAVTGQRVGDQKEICLTIDDFKKAVSLLEHLGCRQKALQENKRELWQLRRVEITIDEWPFLEPFVEIEGESEEAVRKASHKLGFDYKKAVFGSIDLLYSQKYKLPAEVISNETPLIFFRGPNPFLRRRSRRRELARGLTL